MDTVVEEDDLVMELTNNGSKTDNFGSKKGLVSKPDETKRFIYELRLNTELEGDFGQ
ncbi:hypothetical protein HDU78_010035 [Chytriomyces hyalinus]|nr:hypothetical protein HDU78_010035 [Chytriomyces hyalinus]